MRIVSFNRYALSVSVAAALVTGCGGLQPIGAPSAVQQSGIRPGSSSYKVLYGFDEYPNGEEPLGGLLDEGGTLYGAASNGGLKKCFERRSGGCGTVFSITPKGAEKLLYTFTVATGALPQSRLIDVQGTLYGTTNRGGPTRLGTVYSISATGSEAVLYSFKGTTDGAYPSAGVISVNHTLYGTNTYGGGDDHDGGTVYSLSLSGVHTVLHSFRATSDGHDPVGGLIDVNGTLYGTTVSDGRSGACCGIAYSITTSGKETVLYRFAGGSDGARPLGTLLNVNGTLYGTTISGGGTGCSGNGCGTVYTITTSGKEKVLYRFGGSDGANPAAGLIDVNGTLYGTTIHGGAPSCSCGTVYSISTSGAETVLHSFVGGADGEYPQAPLAGVKGTLYGTTASGGDPQKGECCGTVFALTP
jgi:uncharacterized repeat protein (TIGR03803 family)